MGAPVLHLSGPGVLPPQPVMRRERSLSIAVRASLTLVYVVVVVAKRVRVM